MRYTGHLLRWAASYAGFSGAMQPKGAPAAIVSSVPVYRKGLIGLCESAGIPTVEAARPEDLAGAGKLGGVIAPVQTASEWGFLERHCAAHEAPPFIALVPMLSALAAERALAAGASGVIEIDASDDALINVITAGLQEKTLLPHKIMWQIAQDAARARPLSAAEIDWLRTLARGSTVSTLASEVGYSEREMYRHLSQLYARLGVRGRTEALLYVQRLGLLGEDEVRDDASP